jgi:tRNA pseudouridine55 synthase
MRGEAVDIPARQVHISACDILKYDFPGLSLRVECSSGTYIRSLAHDLGQVMGCGAYLSGLVRTKVGNWALEQSVKLDQLKWTDVVPLKDLLKPLPSRLLSDVEWEEISHGRVIEGSTNGASVLVAWYGELPVAILEDSKKVSGALKPRKVL